MSLFLSLTARWDPTAPAITSSGVTTTYGELAHKALQTAAWLREQGLRPGDVVAVQLPKSLGFLELHLATLAMGAAFLPLNPDYTEREVDELLEDSGATLVLRDLETLAGRHDPDPFVPEPLSPDTVAVLMYTSGTTGRAKGAQIRHRNLEATVEALHAAWHWRADDVLLHALPLFHVHGLFVAQHGAMRAGAHAIWLDRFDADAVLETLPRATVFMGVPTYYHRLLQRGPRGDLSGMRLFTSGSAPLPASDHSAFESAFGHRILERYGMTEIGIVLSNPYRGERRPGSVGLPLDQVEVRIVDSDDRDVEQGTVGQVLIRGPSVFAGYLGRPEATAEALAGGWMHTGDMGRMDLDGYIHLVGRSSDLILSGGMNVYPSEVESVLRELGVFEEVAVFGIPDPDLGERVAAAVVTRSPWDESVWVAHCRSQLAPHKRPRAWFAVDALPRNSMGKVQKARLRSRFGTLGP